MADYYPVLAKAVAGLKDAAPEARQAIYERARKALSGQLRNLDPPIPEEAIAREAQALEIAVAQLETEVAAHSAPGNGLPTAESDFYGLWPVDDRFATTPQSSGQNTPPPEPFAPNAKSQAGFPSESVEDTEKPQQARRFRDRRKAREEHLEKAAENGVAAAGETGSMWPDAGRNADLSAPEPLAVEASDLSGSATDRERSNGPPIMRVETHNSFALEPERENGHTKRLIAVFGIVGLVVILIAIAAYRLRDRPEDLVRVQPSPVQSAAASGDKIADRVGDRANLGSSPPSAGLSDQEKPGAGPVVASLPVAHRAAILVQAKDDPTKVNTYIGRVVWRAENISGGPDEPLRTAVQAEVEIPEQKFRATVTIQKNFDSTLPASHTVKLVFDVPGDGPLGNIKQISAVQMRQEDTPVGDTLAGITVPIVQNSFLVGLARGDAEAINLERLRTREWLDVPMVLANGLSAKLTLEKGPSGQRVINDAIASWQAQ